MCEKLGRGFEHMVELRANNPRKARYRDEELRIRLDPAPPKIRAQHVK